MKTVYIIWYEVLVCSKMAPIEWQPVTAAPIPIFVYSAFFALLAFLYCCLFYSSRSRSCPFLGGKLVRLLLCFLLFSVLLNAASVNTHNGPAVYTRAGAPIYVSAGGCSPCLHDSLLFLHAHVLFHKHTQSTHW